MLRPNHTLSNFGLACYTHSQCCDPGNFPHTYLISMALRMGPRESGPRDPKGMEWDFRLEYAIAVDFGDQQVYRLPNRGLIISPEISMREARISQEDLKFVLSSSALLDVPDL